MTLSKHILWSAIIMTEVVQQFTPVSHKLIALWLKWCQLSQLVSFLNIHIRLCIQSSINRQLAIGSQTGGKYSKQQINILMLNWFPVANGQYFCTILSIHISRYHNNEIYHCMVCSVWRAGLVSFPNIHIRLCIQSSINRQLAIGSQTGGKYSKQQINIIMHVN